MSASARFQNCELWFDITRFFSIGYIGEVCSNSPLKMSEEEILIQDSF